ncbi:hypothetical protein RHGRI_030315 [Rhododendron griersonianum]|uniref:non-specific serine/threonine protein kinase n=1 Tax=Rhododendron griersonianum TaxID=479676 RepID=A0AAV6IRL9_9ERIC|nr:hypothetical protein RHGRI_030315 [Rhododendron griersonianum]
MGLAANPIPAVVLLLSLLAAALPASAKLKTSSPIHFDNFFNNNSDTHKLDLADSATSVIRPNALQLTPDTIVDSQSFTNQSGRILYNIPFKLWEGRSDAYLGWVASFNTSFLVNMYRLKDFPTPGEGMAFVVAPDLDIPPNSSGEYLGLTNATTDGNASNHLIAVELDTFNQDFDPNSHHVGLNINSVRHNKTPTWLTTPLKDALVAPYGQPGYYFNVWIEYDGKNKFIAVYIASQNKEKDPTPPKPAHPILNSSLELRGVVKQYSYFGFSASTGNITAQLNCVLRWNLTVEYYYDINWVKIVLIVGIPTVVLLPTSVVLVYYFRKRWLLRRSDRKMSGKVKSMPGMPRVYQYRDLQKATNNFDKAMKLGQGGYGVVYKGKLANQKDLEAAVNQKDLDVAVKMFSRESLKGQDDFFQELTIINQLRHKNLVPLLGQLLEAVDHKLGEDYVAEEAQRFLLLGLGCSHPIASERPKSQEIVQMLSGSMPVPRVPSFKPPYALAPLPMLEEDIIPATTTDTTFFTAADCGSGSAPVAINLEIQRPSRDSYINII